MSADCSRISHLLKESARDMKKLAEKLDDLPPGRKVFIGTIPYEVQADKSLKRIGPDAPQAARRIGSRFRPFTERK